MSVRVLYDHCAFDMQTHGGVSRCFAELYSCLPDRIEAQISVRVAGNVYLKQLGFRPIEDLYDDFITSRDFLGKKFLYKLYYNFCYGDYSRWDCRPRHNLGYSIRLLEEQQFDIFHPTFFDDYFLPYIGDKPFVVTVHDMIPELYPQYYSDDYFQIVKKKILLPKAAHIIAVSENTKKDIVNIMGIPEEKISVVYHGVNTDIYEKPSCPIFDFPYILYVGDRKAYKNFDLFFVECLTILRKYPEIKVVCTGKPFNRKELAMFGTNGVSDRFVYKFGETNQQMFDLYHGAEAFVYPSAYEGFGIPVLEAYKADCPVMLNEASCFPEIAGDAAVYFHIGQPSDLSIQFDRLYNMSDSEKEMLLQKQRDRMKLFSWQKSARQLADIYEKVLSK